MQGPGIPDIVFREEKKLLQILKHVDLVLEVLDARMPLTSRNTRLAAMLAAKNVIILNKADLAERAITDLWLDFYHREGRPALTFSTKNAATLKALEKNLLKRSPQNLKFNRPLRLVVAGIPNVGKSSIINRLAGRFALKTGARPGITRGPQWIRLRAGWEMLDTPGIIHPYLRNENSRLALTLIGALETEAAQVEDVARWFFSRVSSRDELSGPFARHYLGAGAKGLSFETLLTEIGRARGCLGAGGMVDHVKTANMIIHDFRRGAFGRISLENPEMVERAEG